MTDWNKKQSYMSLAHFGVEAENGTMSKHSQDNPLLNTHRPNFSPSEYREAMGPGYSVALFREQQALTGEVTPMARRVGVRATVRLHTTEPRRVARLRLRIENLLIWVRGHRRIAPRGRPLLGTPRETEACCCPS